MTDVTMDELRARQSELAKKNNKLDLQIRELLGEQSKVQNELREANENVAKWKFEQNTSADYTANPHMLQNLVEDAWQGGRPRRHALATYNMFLHSFDSRFTASHQVTGASFSISFEEQVEDFELLAANAEKVAKLLIVAQGLAEITIGASPYAIVVSNLSVPDQVAKLLAPDKKILKEENLLEVLEKTSKNIKNVAWLK